LYTFYADNQGKKQGLIQSLPPSPHPSPRLWLAMASLSARADSTKDRGYRTTRFSTKYADTYLKSKQGNAR